MLYAAAANQHFVGFMEDDAQYVLGAKSLLTGQYADINLPHPPPTVSPMPGFSLFLTPFVALVGKHFNILKILMAALILLCGYLLHNLLKPWGTPSFRIWVTAVFLFNPLSVLMSDLVLSETCSLAATLLLLWLIRRWGDSPPSPGEALICGSLMSWINIMRPEGTLLTVAVGIALIRRQRWRAVIPCVGIALTIYAAWLIRTKILTGSSSDYFLALGDYQGGALERLGTYLRQSAKFMQVVFGSGVTGIPMRVLMRWPALAALTTLAVLVCCGRGIYSIWQQRKDRFRLEIILIFGGSYVLLHSLAPYLDIRYALLLLPFLLMFVLAGINNFFEMIPSARRFERLFWAGPVLIYLIANGSRLADSWLNRNPYFYKLPSETIQWVVNNTPESAMILTNKPSMFYLYTRRFTTTIREVEPHTRPLHAIFKSHGISYILLRPQPLGAPQRLRTWLTIQGWAREAQGSGVLRVYENSAEGTIIYQLT